MNKNFGTLTVKSEGSEIFINGKKKGNGVFQGNLNCGKHHYTILTEQFPAGTYIVTLATANTVENTKVLISK